MFFVRNGQAERYHIIGLVTLLLLVNILMPRWVCTSFYWDYRAAIAQNQYQGAALFGEFNAILADYCIIEADRLWEEGRWYAVPFVYRIILALQPAYISFWSLLGWYYAFNVSSYYAGTDKERAAIEEGVAVLRHGLRIHYAAYNLYFNIAWIYYKKLHDYKRAAQYAEKAREYPHPFSVDRLAALAMFRSGDRAGAEKLWESYLSTHPGNTAARTELEHVRAARGETR